MKQFGLYTLLRLGLVAVVFGVLWLALHSVLTVFPILLLSMLISAIIAIFLLRRQRDDFAKKVAERADRIQAARRDPADPADRVAEDRADGGADGGADLSRR